MKFPFLCEFAVLTSLVSLHSQDKCLNTNLSIKCSAQSLSRFKCSRDKIILCRSFFVGNLSCSVAGFVVLAQIPGAKPLCSDPQLAGKAVVDIRNFADLFARTQVKI